jgi:hypothetical protein
LEKPPLPRWTIASLMVATGLRDEAIVRLPSALTALAMVGLVYSLGRRMGGRSVGLAAGLILSSMCFFVIESRQAGNDGPLAFFTTLALYAAFRRLHGTTIGEAPGRPGDHLGGWGWSVLFWVAMGLGFLSKGPVILLIALLALVPYLLASRRFVVGSRAILSGTGVLAFLVLSFGWPVAVLLSDPNAAKIWWLEMGQKAGTAGITHHKQRSFINDWPWMTAPWSLLATWALVSPFLGRGKSTRPVALFAWFWAVSNLLMFSLWSVAKPNYYVPCEPAVALLSGVAWVDLVRLARDTTSAHRRRASRFVQLHWLLLSLAAVAAPVFVLSAMQPGSFLEKHLLNGRIAPELAPKLVGPVILAAIVVLAGVGISVLAWRKRVESAVLTGMVASICGAMLIGYAFVVPMYNAAKSHRTLAAQLDAVLPPETKTVMFFRELDEGLWFYLKTRQLTPVPGSTPRYSKAADLIDAYEKNTLEYDDAKRILAERKILVDWLDGDKHESPYVLIRAKSFDLFSPGIAERAEPVFREAGIDRNTLMLLRVRTKSELAKRVAAERR